jgi:phosphate transport system substrate-binding protein
MKFTKIWLPAALIMVILLGACTSTDTQQPVSQNPVENQPVQPTQSTSSSTTGSQTAMSENKVTLPDIDPASVSGPIIMAGSSTVYPLAERMAERFEAEGFAGRPTIESIGSGAGFERFCKNAETDIANASRAIKDSEVESCQANGREPIEFRVGTDALAVVASRDNTFLTDITMEELAKAFSNETILWSDVNPSWPAETIRRYSPGTDSGTYDFFLEAVMQPVFGKDNAARAILDAPEIQLSEDDNVLVQGVLGSPYAIGYFGYAYFQENEGTLKALSVNGVEPNPETTEDGRYPLARPLFIYSDAQIMQDKPQVAAYINFFLSYVNEEVMDVGYFPASAAALEQARQKWLDAMN